MQQQILAIAVNIVAIIMIVVTAYLNANHYNFILPLSTRVISKDDKEDILKRLSNNRYAFYISGALNLLNLLLPIGLFKFIIPIITVLVMCAILNGIFSDAVDTEVTEKDISAAEAYRREKREEIRNKAIARKEKEAKKEAQEKAQEKEKEKENE